MTAPAAATLVLAGSGASPSGTASSGAEVFGLPLLRRTAVAAERAGFDRIFVVGAAVETEARCLVGTRAHVPGPDPSCPVMLQPGRIVLLPDNVVATQRWLADLRATFVEPGQLHRLGDGAVVETDQPAALSAALAAAPTLASLLAEWSGRLAPGAPVTEVPSPLRVSDASDVAAAESLLLKSVVKDGDGILTKFVSRRISLAVTRRLAATAVTPNAMTLFTAALGLAAAWSFASPALPRQIAGGLLFLLHSILDGCDGELARLKFRESRFGGLLDFWGDNVVHVAVFSSFAIAWRTASGRPWPLVLGLVAVAGTILSAGFMYFYSMRPRAGTILPAGSSSRRSRRVARVLDAVSGRDFIYLVMVLALFGRAYWFLAAAAVGTLSFFTALLVAAARARDAAIPARPAADASASRPDAGAGEPALPAGASAQR
jgi:1L-myo-inositol 1-phosphate cytidylyltransferase / CDP-L-myo-inositol myo-inositolphosphotransferase